MNNLPPKAPCVGNNVVWYPHGDIAQKPFAATIVDRLNDECITIYTLSPTGRMEPKLNVKHISHPDHDHSPQGLLRWGSWGVIGAHEKGEAGAEKKKMDSMAKSKDEAIEKVITGIGIEDEPDEIEQSIIDMAQEIGDIPGRARLIADKLKGGMTHQRVNAILRRFPSHLQRQAAGLAEGE